MLAEDVQRFWSKVDKTESCWNWKAGKVQGYGQITIKMKNWRAHRLALLLSGIDIPKDKVVDHICKNRSCVNPKHLRLVTVAENTLENSNGITAKYKQKKFCNRGHPLFGTNVRFYKNWRRCRSCDVINSKKGNARRKAERHARRSQKSN